MAEVQSKVHGSTHGQAQSRSSKSMLLLQPLLNPLPLSPCAAQGRMKWRCSTDTVQVGAGASKRVEM